MNPEKYGQAKKLFFELSSSSTADVALRLEQVAQSDPELANEVRSLLAHHQSKTIVQRDEASKATLGSLSRSLGARRWQSRLVGGGWPLLAALIATIVLGLIVWSLQYQLKHLVEKQCDELLVSSVSHKEQLIREWTRSLERRFIEWGRTPRVVSLVEKLNAISDESASSNLKNESLRKAPEQEEFGSLFAKLSRQPERIVSNGGFIPERLLRYAVFNRRFELVADWQHSISPQVLAANATPEGARMLAQVFNEGRAITLLPWPNDPPITVGYPMEVTSRYVMFLVPIFASDDDTKVIATMMIRGSEFLEQLDGLLDMSPIQSGHFYLLTKEGSIASSPPDMTELVATPFFSDVKDIVARDPGGDLLKGFKPTKPLAQWARTLPARSLAMMTAGSNVEGYRDYRGKIVVGAWRWVDTLGMGLVFETERDNALDTYLFVKRISQWIWLLPLGTFILLIGIAARDFIPIKPRKPRFVAGYELFEKIGEGGAAEVYRAQHLILGRLAAIKIFQPLWNDDAQVQRFAREVQIAARIQHPNVVTIFDVGLTPPGWLYCSMEFLDGVTLAKLIQREPDLSIRRIVSILSQVASALNEAHSLGLVHRDIKPQNIMICRREDGLDLVKVVDFGLAKNISQNTNRNEPMTQVLVGTPGFIAPERIETPWAADPKVDIYAFGVCGILMIVGTVPSVGTDLATLQRLLSQSRFGPIANETYIKDLLDLLSRCIAPSPSDRPSVMQTIVQELNRISELTAASESNSFNK